MHISRLALDHYRSWSQVVVDFVPGVNILFGKNGLGKTNLVEAVEVLSTGSSHRTSSTLPLIERGQTTATIRANVADDAGQTTTYEASIHARGANRARINSGSSLYPARYHRQDSQRFLHSRRSAVGVRRSREHAAP